MPHGVDALFDLPPGEFVAARDAMAKQLRRDGDKDAAKEVAALRRPTVVAWALNRLSRDERDGIDELAAAGDAVRDAQAALLSGDTTARAALDDAAAWRRRVADRLTDAAVAVVGETHRVDIRASLDAASSDDAALAALRGGRLSAELQRPDDFGFGMVAAPVRATQRTDADPPPTAKPAKKAARRSTPEPPPPPPRQRKPSAAALRKVAAAEDRLARAEQRLAEAQEAVAAARTALDQARADLTD